MLDGIVNALPMGNTWKYSSCLRCDEISLGEWFPTFRRIPAAFMPRVV